MKWKFAIAAALALAGCTSAPRTADQICQRAAYDQSGQWVWGLAGPIGAIIAADHMQPSHLRTLPEYRACMAAR